MFTLREVETALLGGPESGLPTIITGVSTDSRSVGAGDLFVCIEGENFDGHGFAAQAVKNGAAGIIASRLLPEVQSVPIVLVRNTVAALGLLAAHRRQKFEGKVVVITGSAGKTTVKELLAASAATQMPISKNMGNLNNQIGLPLSIFRADMAAKAWIMEAGISMPHDMDELGPIGSPDIAIIHNIGPAHLEGLGSIEGVARAKASLLDHLSDSGVGIVNKDYELLWNAAEDLCDNLVPFSTMDEDCEYYSAFLETSAEGMGRYLIRTPDGEANLTLPQCGAHHAENLAAVAAGAHQLGLPLSAVVKGAAEQKTMKQRFVARRFGGVTLIDDTYNANPVSMRSSMQAARDMANGTPLVLVLADMKELGEFAQQAHRELGELAKSMAPAALLFKGDHDSDVAEGFGTSMRTTGTPGDTVRTWRELALSEAVVLVKGSRSCRMEEHAAALAHEFQKEDTAG